MNFDHTDDRRMLGDMLARALGDTYPIETRNRGAYGETGYDAAAWAQLSELGVIGALFDESAGGFGGSGFDIMVVFEALGRALSVEPVLGALMAGRALAAAGGQDAVLAGIVAGETIAAFADDDSATPVTATADGDGWRLSGTKAVVPQAGAAQVFVVTAGDDVFLVPADAAGVSVRSYNLIDGGAAGEVTLDGVAATRIGGAAARDAAIEAGLLALSAESVGAMEFVKEATLGYLRDRKQFGVPIGKFQALQHRMADVLLEIEQARSSVINAAVAFDATDAKARARALAAAKYTIGRTGQMVAEESVQMHGGIGMTWEYAVSHYVKRLVMIDHQLGDEDFHLQRFIALGR
ncbi:acyl-CoA dehydrogenase [Sphingomonas sp.]|jgi:alkylation response protein AidB-like acyl-CoA dehydrogenase|uniref:acyl-CoA dehydrogenase family protein n=1 Tax=Sphingomonas sp. TaxID=28214 RepID=UPI002ED7CE01